MTTPNLICWSKEKSETRIVGSQIDFIVFLCRINLNFHMTWASGSFKLLTVMRCTEFVLCVSTLFDFIAQNQAKHFWLLSSLCVLSPDTPLNFSTSFSSGPVYFTLISLSISQLMLIVSPLFTAFVSKFLFFFKKSQYF